MKTTNGLAMSSDQIEALIDGQKQLQKQFNAFASTQDRLISIISGNELDRDDKGLIGDFKEVKADVESLKETGKKFKWTVGGALFAGGIFFTIVQYLIKYVFKI